MIIYLYGVAIFFVMMMIYRVELFIATAEKHYTKRKDYIYMP